MRKTLLTVSVLAVALLPVTVLGDQSDVGNPRFRDRTSSTMTLRYGFSGASVLDSSTKAWVFLPMTTITRGRVDGYVNQVNSNFALAAGLHSIAVYDFSLHRWVESKSGGCDDSTDTLNASFQLTPTSVKVKLLNGPFKTYTTAGGWK